MKLCFIYNPHSGKNRRRPWLPQHIRDFIARRQLDASLQVTSGVGHASHLAREAVSRGCDRVIAVGGDGTMNEVAQSLLHTPAALGLVPCGSGNGLALHLGLPTKLNDALELAATPDLPVATIDTGVVNGRPFFNAMGSGFDAEISLRFNRLNRRGLAAYAWVALRAFWKLQPEYVQVCTRGEVVSFHALLVAVANSDQYGNNAVIAPGAKVDDGQLDLVALKPFSLFAAPGLIRALFRGRLDRNRHVVRLTGQAFTLHRTRSELIHTDGEPLFTERTLIVKVQPASLRVIVPHDRANSAAAAATVAREIAA